MAVFQSRGVRIERSVKISFTDHYVCEGLQTRYVHFLCAFHPLFLQPFFKQDQLSQHQRGNRKKNIADNQSQTIKYSI
jgi:hypothetical protein